MSWTCSLCGLLNNDNHTICQACFTNIGEFNLYYEPTTNQATQPQTKNQIDYISMKTPPFEYDNSNSILYYYSKKTKKHYIIFLNVDDLSTKAVFNAYDIELNNYFELTKVPFELPHQITTVLNTDKNDICLFLGSDRLLATFNIEKQKWHISNYHLNKYIVGSNSSDFMTISYISSVKQFCIHDGVDNVWKKYKENNKKYVIMSQGELHKFDMHTLLHFKLMHVSALKLVLLFGGQYDIEYWQYVNDDGWDSNSNMILNEQIFFIKTDKMKNDRERWKRYKTLKLPKKKWIYRELLALDYILIVFMIDFDAYGNIAVEKAKSLEIWCLDLLFTNKWFKCDKCLSIGTLPDRVFVTKYDYVYAMMGHQKNRKYMIKFHICEVIPSALAKLYISHYSKFVCGYIRLEIEKKIKIQVPMDLKWTIFVYYYPLTA